MVLVRWGVIYERRQGMQRIEYRYKCPTVVRGRQSSPTTLDLESNSPQGSQAACSGHSIDQNSTHGRGPGRTTCYGADLRLRECAFPKHLEHRCCCSCNLCIKQVAHTSQLDGCTSDSNNNNNKQTVRRLTGVFGSLFWLLMTPKLTYDTGSDSDRPPVIG